MFSTRLRMTRSLRSNASPSPVPRAATDEDLADDGFDRGHGRAQQAALHGNVAPPEQPLPLLLRDPHEQRLAGGALRPVPGQEHHADGIVGLVRQGDAGLRRHGPQEPVRFLDQYADAVACERVGPEPAPVVEVPQDLEALLDDPVGFAVPDVDDEADAAAVVLVPGVVKALCWWHRVHGVTSGVFVVIGVRRTPSACAGASQGNADIE